MDSKTGFDLNRTAERREFGLKVVEDLLSRRYTKIWERVACCECVASCAYHYNNVNVALEMIARELVYWGAREESSNDWDEYARLFFGLCERGWVPEVYFTEEAWAAYRRYKAVRASAIAVASLNAPHLGGRLVVQTIARWVWADRGMMGVCERHPGKSSRRKLAL